MGDVDSVVTERRFAVRQLLGWVAAVTTAAVLVVFSLGAWNPWGLTVLWRFAGNWLQGIVYFFVALLITLWLLAPVRNEARHTGRARWRIVVAVLLVFSLIGYGIFGAWIKPGYQIRAHSPDGQRTIVMYGPDSDHQRLHVWVGTGLGQRDAGDLGKPCGPTKVWMDDRNTVHVTTSYITRSLRLDPATGKPLDRLGPTCSE